MIKLSYSMALVFKRTALLGLVVLVVVPLAGPGWAASSAPAAAGVYQDFDELGVGTDYRTDYHADPSAPRATVVEGGPTGTGNFMRLTFTDTIASQNSIAFTHTDPGAFDLIVADFDFRMTLSVTVSTTPSGTVFNTPRADGLGFALLDTLVYDITGTVEPHDAEEPNFENSLGVGFDIYKSDPDGTPELNNNHVSIHFDGGPEQVFDAAPALDLAGDHWTHARVIMRPAEGYSDVSVILTPCGGQTVTLVDQYPIPYFTRYAGRVYFAARTGGENSNQDIDNVHVQFLNPSDSLMAFSNGCSSIGERDDEVFLTVTRLGDTSGETTVYYATADVLTPTAGITAATAISDYTSVTGTITFTAGEITKILSVPIINDDDIEGDEIFHVVLSDMGEGAVGGPVTAKVTIADDEVSRLEGHWSDAIPIPVIPLHMHLLPTGEVLFWDRHDHADGWDGQPRLWDPATGSIRLAAPLTYDIFCSGHAFLADGRLLVAGGHIVDGVGENKASIYDPFTDSWTRLLNMNLGRWYPSSMTLADGNVLVMGGTTITGVNTIPQVWQVETNTWSSLAAQGVYSDYADYYPFLYQAPQGQIFVAGPQQMARYLYPSGVLTWTEVASSSLPYRDYGSSVMYDGDLGSVLIVGGNPREPDPLVPPTIPPSASAEVITLTDSAPAWVAVDSMNFPRRQLNATLLPDGTVLVTGGTSVPGFDLSAGAVLTAEIWNPQANLGEQWKPMAAQARYRGYHSVALLLPDGRVLVGGGGHPDPAGGAQSNFEIYSPPYLFKGSRPTITWAPTLVTYDETFFVQTADAASIQNVTWIRLGSVTHSFNQNQRLNHLTFTVASGVLNVTAPPEANRAPPGHYMLFILNADGVPSVAHIIRVVPPTATSAPLYLPLMRK